MDNTPFRENSTGKKISKEAGLKYILLCFFSICLILSCSDSAPSIVNSEAKIVFDFQDEKSLPVQKMNLFVKMTSDSRRAESINVYHNESGYRWVINNPVISQVDNYYFAGYTNIQATGNTDSRLPEGEYSICYMDAQGREEYSTVRIKYDEKFLKMKSDEILKFVSNKNPVLYAGIYSKNQELIYFGTTKKEWNITKEMKDINRSRLFNSYKDAEFFRVFIELDDCVFVMPEINK